MRKQTTIKDIAVHLGVSNTTVSAVLAHSPSAHVRVSEATRFRVQEAALALRYRPNRVARSLRYQKTNLIGVYSTHGYLDPYTNFTAQVIAGLRRACDVQHKDLLLHGSYPGRSVEEIHAELADGRIDGLILYTQPNDPLVARLTDNSLPVVAVIDQLPGLPSVLADDAGGSRLLAAHLAAQGHRRIFYRSGNPDVISAVVRQAAFEQAAAALGLKITNYARSFPFQGVVDAEMAWLDLPSQERPTAAVCWNDLTAYSLLSWCRERGVRVPEDLAVVGFDDVAPPHAEPLRLTTIRAPWVKVAAKSVELLVRRIEGEPIAADTTLPVAFVAGDTA
jgi:LacI family transcriptional regulator